MLHERSLAGWVTTPRTHVRRRRLAEHRMRCILTVNFSPWSRYSGGGQRSTHNLARALARRGHDVTVVYTKPPWERVQLPAALPYAVRWASLPALRSRSGAWLRPASTLFVAREVKRLLSPGCVVHGNGEEAALVPGLRGSTRFGFVMTPRYPELPRPFKTGAARSSRLLRTALAITHGKYVLLGRALAGADRICPTSAFASELVARAYPFDPASVRVIPNGISDEFLQPTAARPSTGTEPFAIYFGRLAREKGVHVLLDAIARAGSLPIRFVLAGRGPELERLRARARDLQHVRFETWLDARELAALVQRASFAVLPSLEESFGNTMAEAMALGVPVIATTAGSIPELIEHEATGLLVPPGDAPALAAAIARLASDASLRGRLGAAARTRAGALSWDAVAARFEDVYAEAIRVKI